MSCSSKNTIITEEPYIKEFEKIIILEEYSVDAVKNKQKEVDTQDKSEGDSEIIELEDEILTEILEKNEAEKIACYSVVKSNGLKNIVKKFLYDKCYINRKDNKIRCNKTNIFIQKVMTVEETCACFNGKLCRREAMVEQHILDKYILKISSDKKHKKIFTKNLRIYDYQTN
jgi:hypothetical protein